MKAFLTLFCLTASLTFAQGRMEHGPGNGGGVHDCGDSIELYDLFEGRHHLLHGLRIPEDDGQTSVRAYLAEAVAKIRNLSADVADLIERKLRFLLAQDPDDYILDIEIPRIQDADIPFVARGCEYKQVANWNERVGKVFFDKALFDRLDNLSKAALYLHEATYKVARFTAGAGRSDAVREFVAEVFSTQMITALPIPLDYSSEDYLFLETLDRNGVNPDRCELEFKVVTMNGDAFQFPRVSGLRFVSDMSAVQDIAVLSGRSFIRANLVDNGQSTHFSCRGADNKLDQMRIMMIGKYDLVRRVSVGESDRDGREFLSSFRNQIENQLKFQIFLNGRLAYEARVVRSDSSGDFDWGGYAYRGLRVYNFTLQRENIDLKSSIVRRWRR